MAPVAASTTVGGSYLKLSNHTWNTGSRNEGIHNNQDREGGKSGEYLKQIQWNSELEKKHMLSRLRCVHTNLMK